jgi:hypothetical protein
MAQQRATFGRSESKAIKTLMSARDVAVEVENIRRRRDGRMATRAQAAKLENEENEALARLCNLISLALAETQDSTDERFRARFDEILGEVQGRLMKLNYDQIMARLEAIRTELRTALETEFYRMGLAAKLGRAYAEVMDNLNAMGAADHLGDGAQVLAAVVQDIRTLAEIEDRVFRLRDFDVPPPDEAG